MHFLKFHGIYHTLFFKIPYFHILSPALIAASKYFLSYPNILYAKIRGSIAPGPIILKYNNKIYYNVKKKIIIILLP